MWGQLCCLRELVEGGGDHCLVTNLNETPGQLALRYGNSDCAEYLSRIGQNYYYRSRLAFSCDPAIPYFSDARHVLRKAIQAGRDTLANSDLIAGKWNKDDKV